MTEKRIHFNFRPINLIDFIRIGSGNYNIVNKYP